MLIVGQHLLVSVDSVADTVGESALVAVFFEILLFGTIVVPSRREAASRGHDGVNEPGHLFGIEDVGAIDLFGFGDLDQFAEREPCPLPDSGLRDGEGVPF